MGSAPNDTEPSVLSAGLRCRCPRCGQGHLFSGFLTLQPECDICHLDFLASDSADGPAYFVMSIVGLIVVGLALWVEFRFEPPIWLHIAIWFPLTIILSLLLIRPAKALMIAIQYHNNAQEGRFR
ncbi:DUF983 domain-containing protein [Microvirga sp. W0021]|uniref:DUF983 domain-containing protein n=1 Tax=Hohaiivirga grylli TaxID=3133970 RepID=A0ABV0BHB3_9HYPH